MALGRDRSEGLVGTLQDSLGSDVDPRPGGHLTEHREPELVQPAELLPGRPLRYEVGVGDEHPRRPLVGPEDAHGLAGLDEQRLLGPERLAGSRRSRHKRPSYVPPCLHRRRRSAGRDARRCRGRGCSSACASPLPAASLYTRARCRAAHARCAVHWSSRHRPADSTGLAAALEAGGSTSTPMCKT